MPSTKGNPIAITLAMQPCSVQEVSGKLRLGLSALRFVSPKTASYSKPFVERRRVLCT